MDIVIASFNLHKIREYKQMFKSRADFDVYSLRDFGDYHPPEETGITFEANAILKAVDASKKIGKLVIADDSGLVVPSLDGDPGVYSARYAGEDATDADNRKKLLKAMQGKDQDERAAYFECFIAIAENGKLQKTVSGRCEGYIIDEERGAQGFGYDAVFVRNDYDKTFAEIDDSIKNRVSHRAKAFDKLMVYFDSIRVNS